MKIKKVLLWIFVSVIVIALIILGIIAYFLYPWIVKFFPKLFKTRNSILKDIKSFIISSISKSNYTYESSEINGYKDNSTTYMKNMVDNCFRNQTDCNVLGIAKKILYDFSQNKDDDYKNYITDFIKGVNKVIDETHPNFSVNNNLDINHWYGYIFLLTYYEYIVEYESSTAVDSKTSICHSKILEISPALDKISNNVFKDNQVARGYLPRFLTNYLYDEKAYNEDLKKSEAINKLKQHINTIRKSFSSYAICNDDDKYLAYHIYDALNI